MLRVLRQLFFFSCEEEELSSGIVALPCLVSMTDLSSIVCVNNVHADVQCMLSVHSFR